MTFKKLNSPSATLFGCYFGYVTQAVINNLAPLLFVTFYEKYGLQLTEIGLLISVNFGVQMLMDLLATKLLDKVGYRPTVVTAHGLAVVGLIAMGVLPTVMTNTFAALLISYILNAMGSGFIEVTLSPVVESVPGGHKAARMSLLHSFYCWGQVAVVVLSTLFFVLFGKNHWQFLPMVWALIPLINGILFFFVPLYRLVEEGKGLQVRTLLSSPVFLLLLLMMASAGASELAMSQWSSLFAELGLNVSKTLGDLFGPCAFAVLMGLARVGFSLFGKRVDLPNLLFLSAALCVGSYALAALSPIPVLSLVGCALTGLGVGILWPGIFSYANEKIPRGGTAMFALLALAGDIGCITGPAIVGKIAESVPPANFEWLSADSTVAGLKLGLLISVVFPLLMTAGITAIKFANQRNGFVKLNPSDTTL